MDDAYMQNIHFILNNYFKNKKMHCLNGLGTKFGNISLIA